MERKQPLFVQEFIAPPAPNTSLPFLMIVHSPSFPYTNVAWICMHTLAHAELKPLQGSCLALFAAGQTTSTCISSLLTLCDLLFPEYTPGGADRKFQNCHHPNIHSKMTPCPVYCVSFNDSPLPITR